jgi:hypothetical protein
MGCGASCHHIVDYGIPVVHKEYGQLLYNTPYVTSVPMGVVEQNGIAVPEKLAKLGWYNLKFDQLVTTKTAAIPPGFDLCAVTPSSIGGRQMLVDHEKDMHECTVGAVIGDSKDTRYVKVTELVGVRRDETRYVIRGRIEKQSWKDIVGAKLWVNILMVQIKSQVDDNIEWMTTSESDWCAVPVEEQVAAEHFKNQELPNPSFETWLKGYMDNFYAAAKAAIPAPTVVKAE